MFKKIIWQCMREYLCLSLYINFPSSSLNISNTFRILCFLNNSPISRPFKNFKKRKTKQNQKKKKKKNPTTTTTTKPVTLRISWLFSVFKSNFFGYNLLLTNDNTKVKLTVLHNVNILQYFSIQTIIDKHICTSKLICSYSNLLIHKINIFQL